MTLPAAWELATLGDLVTDIESGKNFTCLERPPARSEQGLLKISAVSRGVFVESESKTVPPDISLDSTTRVHRGDLLFSRANTIELVGMSALVEHEPTMEVHITDKVMRLKLPAELVPWAHRYLSSPQARREIQSRSSGNQLSMRNISQAELKQVSVPLPSLPEQRRIVARIEELTARSKNAKQALQAIPPLLEKFRQSVLAAAFRGDLTAEWRRYNPNVEPATSLVTRIPAPLQPRGGRDASIQIIPGVAALSVNDPGSEPPPNWAWVPLTRLSRQETGHTPSRSHPEWWNGDVPWVGIRDAADHHGRVIHDTLQYTNQEGLNNSAARLLPVNTVCLSRTASVGYVVILGRPMATSQDFVTWSCSEALNPEYLLYALMAEHDHIRRFGQGTTHTTIYFPEVRAMHICLAPLEEQLEIVRQVKSSLKYVDHVASVCGQLLELPDRIDQSILAKAFCGQLVPQDPNDEPASALLERLRAHQPTAMRSNRK